MLRQFPFLVIWQFGKIMDINFYNVIQKLNESNVSYWVCHGSLLGLARSGDLIPWDHDVDIAVWKGEYTEEHIISIFELMGFKWIVDHPAGSLKFERGDARSVDVNLYKECQNSKTLACCLHRIPKSKARSLLDKLVNNIEYDGKFLILMRMLRPFRKIFVPLHKMLNRAGMLYTEKGYSTPKSLLINFCTVDYFGVECRVPEEFEAINAFIYGDDWREPKEVYDWMVDSPSIMDKTS